MGRAYLSSTTLQLDVVRKSKWMFIGSQLIQTAIYLDFHSHHPSGQKRSVVNTLLLRERNIPSTNKGKREETRRVKAVLRGNNYPMTSSFINDCEKVLGITKPTKPTTNGFCSAFICSWCLWKIIGRLLKQQQIQVLYKPQKKHQQHFSTTDAAG